MNVEQKVRDYIEEFVLYGDSLESDDASLLESGVIDSSGAMEMVMFLEEEFKISIEDEEIVPTNLDTVNLISTLVKGKLDVEVAA